MEYSLLQRGLVTNGCRGLFLLPPQQIQKLRGGGNGIHTINRIYQGTSISTEYICQLSQVLGVSTDYLLLGKKDRMEEKPSREEIFQILGGLDDTKLIKLAGAAKILYDIA